MTSAGIYKINFTNLSTVHVPLPPLPRQSEIAQVCAEISESLEKSNCALRNRLAALHWLPAALLHDAFNGRI